MIKQAPEETLNSKTIIKTRKVSVPSTFDLERKLLASGYDFVVGIDEVGRGPLAGPVVACAASLKVEPSLVAASKMLNVPFGHPVSKEWDLVRDSKKVSEKQREEVFDFILENFHVGIGICDHITIDRINILEASFLAMKKALSDLNKNINKENPACKIQNTKYIILVDGNKDIPNLSSEQKAIVGGDGIVKSISAASIIAKVTRDRILMDMHGKYPVYGFDSHKGYGTKQHMEMLQTHGPCEIHRKSFEPMRSLAKKVV